MINFKPYIKVIKKGKLFLLKRSKLIMLLQAFTNFIHIYEYEYEKNAFVFTKLISFN